MIVANAHEDHGKPIHEYVTEHLTVRVYGMKTGGFYLHAEHANGWNYYSPITRYEFTATGEATRMIENQQAIDIRMLGEIPIS